MTERKKTPEGGEFREVPADVMDAAGKQLPMTPRETAEQVLEDALTQGTGITEVQPDGSERRVDPREYFKRADEEEIPADIMKTAEELFEPYVALHDGPSEEDVARLIMAERQRICRTIEAVVHAALRGGGK